MAEFSLKWTSTWRKIYEAQGLHFSFCICEHARHVDTSLGISYFVLVYKAPIFQKRCCTSMRYVSDTDTHTIWPDQIRQISIRISFYFFPIFGYGPDTQAYETDTEGVKMYFLNI